MIDMEKVIKGLECLSRNSEQIANPCAGCGYNGRPNFAFCVVDIANDCLALLKEQEAVIPLTIDDAVSEIIDKHYKRLKRQETEGL